jgi:hypothetical protein
MEEITPQLAGIGSWMDSNWFYVALFFGPAIIGFFIWLFRPPTWRDLDKDDFQEDETFWDRFLGSGRGWFRWW